MEIQIIKRESTGTGEYTFKRLRQVLGFWEEMNAIYICYISFLYIFSKMCLLEIKINKLLTYEPVLILANQALWL